MMQTLMLMVFSCEFVTGVLGEACSVEPDKTKFMLHSSRQLLSQLPDFRLSLHEKCFLPEKVIKYFGVTFDPNLTF